jgi:hypothetical protein
MEKAFPSMPVIQFTVVFRFNEVAELLVIYCNYYGVYSIYCCTVHLSLKAFLSLASPFKPFILCTVYNTLMYTPLVALRRRMWKLLGLLDRVDPSQARNISAGIC